MQLSWIQWDSFWGFFVCSVVQVQVHAIVVVFVSGVVSGLDSFLGSVDLWLGDIDVPVVDPHWVRSQLVSSAIAPGSSSDVGHCSALVVLVDSHGSLVLLVVQGLKLQELELLSLQWIKGKVGTNANNIVLFFKTSVLVIIIGNKASLVSGNGPKTELWQGDDWEAKLIASAGCVLDTVMEFSSGIGEGVVVRWPVLVKVDCVGVCLENYLWCTSGKYHLAPCLDPTAILSLVGTCWTAKGLIDDTALLNESNYYGIEWYLSMRQIHPAYSWCMDKGFYEFQLRDQP